VRRPRRRALSKRYGCFKLPRVRGARTVACAGGSKKCEGPRIARARGAVSWLARTDPRAKTIEFSEAFGELTPEGKRYITAHEEAHLRTGPDHNSRFYEVLKRLVKERRIDWEVAYELESYNCHAKH
jgi:hypothetical protein